MVGQIYYMAYVKDGFCYKVCTTCIGGFSLKSFIQFIGREWVLVIPINMNSFLQQKRATKLFCKSGTYSACKVRINVALKVIWVDKNQKFPN